MIASFINDNHETWDQFLREFAYTLRTAVHETTKKTPAELFLGRKLITLFQKLVMVSDGAEFVKSFLRRLDEILELNMRNGRNITIKGGAMLSLR
ncbi:uncharacterized protein TNCV_3828851 [Trichonephila clavipes]|nr:uncharacterized protein TNCV_3828851 [Trichonephila clavipes]